MSASLELLDCNFSVGRPSMHSYESFGTDFPWFNHHYYIGAVLGADMTDDDRHNILQRNAERLLGITP